MSAESIADQGKGSASSVGGGGDPTVSPVPGRILGCAVAAVVFAIGMAGGGYELPASGEVVLLAAWPLLIGALIGFLPTGRPSAPTLVACGFASLLVAWCLISIGWSDAAGRSVTVAIQYAVVLSVLLLGAVLFRPEHRDHVLGGLLAGVGLIAAAAVASRLNPDLAPKPAEIAGASRMQARLHWPVGYWNTLGFLAAMAVPLALHFAADAKRFLSRWAAGASVPVLAVCILFTLSRGSILIAAIGVFIWAVLSPLSIRRVLVVVILGLASWYLIDSALSRDALMDGLTRRGRGVAEASDFEAVLIVVSALAGLACAGAAFLPKPGRSVGSRVRLPIRAAVALGLIAAVVGVGLAAGAGPRAQRAWDDFRNPSLQVEEGRTNSVERLSATGSSGRWQLWEGAVDEGNTAPLKGTGAGTFELWWSANSSEYMVVRNVHSQYLEAYAELGWIGALLLAGLVLSLAWGLVLAVMRAKRDAGAVGAATATVACFVISSAFDWGWQVTVLPLVAAFAYTAATAGSPDSEGAGARLPSLALRGGLALAAAALVALALPPVVATHAVTRSQQLVRAGDLTGALSQAKSAVAWQPYSAAAWLQEGLVYDRLGAARQARRSVVGAIDREPDGWKNWFVLSAVDARAGNVKGSLRAYRKARDLNPNSPLFRIGN